MPQDDNPLKALKDGQLIVFQSNGERHLAVKTTGLDNPYASSTAHSLLARHFMEHMEPLPTSIFMRGFLSLKEHHYAEKNEQGENVDKRAGIYGIELGDVRKQYGKKLFTSLETEALPVYKMVYQGDQGTLVQVKAGEERILSLRNKSPITHLRAVVDATASDGKEVQAPSQGVLKDEDLVRLPQVDKESLKSLRENLTKVIGVFNEAQLLGSPGGVRITQEELTKLQDAADPKIKINLSGSANESELKIGYEFVSTMKLGDSAYRSESYNIKAKVKLDNDQVKLR